MYPAGDALVFGHEDKRVITICDENFNGEAVIS